jgi:hypothetical protein
MQVMAMKTTALTAISIGLLLSTGCGSDGRSRAGTGGSGAVGGEAGSAGGSSVGGAGGAGGVVGYTPHTWDFAAGLDSWALKYSEPTTLMDATVLAADTTEGSPDAGSLRFEIPFDAASQKLQAGVNFATVNLTGRTISVEARLTSGLTADPSTPGGIKIYVKSGTAYIYADSGFQNLDTALGWVIYEFAVDAPAYKDAGFDPSDVREVGVEIDTNGTGTPGPAVVHVDTLAY